MTINIDEFTRTRDSVSFYLFYSFFCSLFPLLWGRLSPGGCRVWRTPGKQQACAANSALLGVRAGTVLGDLTCCYD